MILQPNTPVLSHRVPQRCDVACKDDIEGRQVGKHAHVKIEFRQEDAK
jgi:hypothetical protein